MRLYQFIVLPLLILLTGSSFRNHQSERVEFVCLKTHKATNTCHYNFKVDGAKYRYVDAGCKMAKKKDEIIKKARDGRLGLARDWKIECPESKN